MNLLFNTFRYNHIKDVQPLLLKRDMNNLSNNILKGKRAELASRMTQSRKSSCPSSTGVF